MAAEAEESVAALGCSRRRKRPAAVAHAHRHDRRVRCCRTPASRCTPARAGVVAARARAVADSRSCRTGRPGVAVALVPADWSRRPPARRRLWWCPLQVMQSPGESVAQQTPSPAIAARALPAVVAVRSVGARARWAPVRPCRRRHRARPRPRRLVRRTSRPPRPCRPCWFRRCRPSRSCRRRRPSRLCRRWRGPCRQRRRHRPRRRRPRYLSRRHCLLFLRCLRCPLCRRCRSSRRRPRAPRRHGRRAPARRCREERRAPTPPRAPRTAAGARRVGEGGQPAVGRPPRSGSEGDRHIVNEEVGTFDIGATRAAVALLEVDARGGQLATRRRAAGGNVTVPLSVYQVPPTVVEVYPMAGG